MAINAMDGIQFTQSELDWSSGCVLELNSMENRRLNSRHRTLKTGRIITHDPFSTIDCLVRNASDSGARIEIEGAVVLPSRFELMFDGRRRSCYVAWKLFHHVGVRFA